jgi:SnoaL-like domain
MPRDKVEVAKRALDANNRRDVDGLFAELVTPDFVWDSAMARGLDGGGYRGREGVERFAADTSEYWEEFQNTAEESMPPRESSSRPGSETHPRCFSPTPATGISARWRTSSTAGSRC